MQDSRVLRTGYDRPARKLLVELTEERRRARTRAPEFLRRVWEVDREVLGGPNSARDRYLKVAAYAAPRAGHRASDRAETRLPGAAWNRSAPAKEPAEVSGILQDGSYN